MFKHDTDKCYTLLIKTNNNADIIQQCSSLKKDGEYCGRHKLNKTNKRVRVDDYQEIINKKFITPSLINFEDFLENQTLNDISLINIFYTLKTYYPRNDFNYLKPDDLKSKLISYYDTLIKARKYTFIYKKIQIKYREKNKLHKLLLHGPCYFDRNLLNNQEDFYTLDNMNEISNDFYFSFLDKNGLYYGFDIRSLKKLIYHSDKGNNNKIINPYSTNELIDNVVTRIYKLINHLESRGCVLDIKSELTPKQKKRDSVIRVFNIIDLLGYQTNIDWLLNMSNKELKKFYHLLEDIWNYRCDLTQQAKREIIPDEDINPLFNISVDSVFNLRKYDDILDINLKIIERLVSESYDLGCRSLGALYVLTALATISYEAGNTYPHLVQMDDFYN
jgi:hypothetical protein